MPGKLTTVGKRFSGRIAILGGQDFIGMILPAPILSTSGQLNPQRYLRTTPHAPVQFGDVISADEQQFIVTEHGEGYSNTPIYHHFKLYPVDAKMSWYSTSEETNSVTGQIIKVKDVEEDDVFLSYITQNARSEELVIGQKMKTAVCNAQVNVGDKVGDYIVTKSAPVLGVRMLELKGL